MSIVVGTAVFTGPVNLSANPTVNLLLANPNFAAQLATGASIVISWSQSRTFTDTSSFVTGGQHAKNATYRWTTSPSLQDRLSAVFTSEYTPPTTVPEPSAVVLGLTGIGLLMLARRKRAN